MAPLEFYSADAPPSYADFAGVPAFESTALPPNREGWTLALSQFERSVLLFNLHVAMVPEGAQPQPAVGMIGAMRMIVDAWRTNDAWMRVGDYLSEDESDEPSDADDKERPNLLSIKDVDWADDGVVTILFSHGDVRAADPALLNFQTGELRTAGKTDVDGLAHAAHLVIATEGPFSRSGQCRALLERVPNVGRATVTTLLNRLLSAEAKKNRMTFIDDDKKNKRCHPKLVGHNQMSHEIREDIQNGKLTAVEFVTHKRISGFEEPNIVAPISRTLRHKITKPLTGDGIFELINRMTPWGRDNGYEDIQIYFNNGRKNRSAIFSTDIADARDLVYSRFEPIRGFSHRLEQHPERIVPEIQEKVVDVLRRESAWQ